MRHWLLGGIFPITAFFLLSIGGCSADKMFVYKPGEPMAGGPKFPVKVAVLAFTDGTEDFTKRGSIFEPESLVYNLAKAGISGWATAMTPELWAKAFTDEMSSSGAFRSVRFIYSPSELVDEDFYIEGTLEKAYAAGGWTRLNEYTVAFQAFRKTDKKPVGSWKVERAVLSRKDIYERCGMDLECSRIGYNAEMNKLMQGMFAEAGTNLAGALAPLLGISIPRGSAESSTPQAPESVDVTIDRILEEK